MAGIKGFIVGLVVCMLITVPFIFRQYQMVGTEYMFSDDMVIYNDLYNYYFDEVGGAVEGDAVLVCWFNVTTQVHVIVGINFNEQTYIYRIGILYYGSSIGLLEDVASPTEGVLLQLSNLTRGLYSCGVFFMRTNASLVDVSVLYLF